MATTTTTGSTATTPTEAPVTEEILRVERRDDGVAVVWFDVPGEKMNTLRQGFEKSFERVFDELDGASDVEGVVLASAKDDNFIAGADIDMLRAVKTADEGAALSRNGHETLARIEGFRLPVVAAVHGACLGGGLEVALACRARIASDDPRTKLGLPEVQLGLIPGAAGTQRLPRLIGIEPALEMILTGKRQPARKAAKLGLVDEVVPAAILVDVAAEHAKRLAKGEGGRRGFLPELPSLKTLLLEDNPLGRKVLFSQAAKGVLGKTHGNYPAPLKAIDVVRTGTERGLEAGLAAEAEAFGELAVSPVARRLTGIFFAQNELKKDTGVDDPEVEPRRVRKVGVLGAGLMGGGIAVVTAEQAKLPVRLRDIDDGKVGRGLAGVRKVWDEKVERKRLDGRERDRLMARVHPTTDYSGFGHADVVIEAVFEDLGIKRKVLAEVEEHGGKETIFASNTSSLPIGEIAAEAKHPERVIGMHYFSPVHKMPLLEIITHAGTAPWVTATCVDLGKKQGKTVIVVHDGPGFYTSRIVGPYGNEAAWIVSEGAPVEEVDRALVKAGFPVGPIKLLDEVGIDVAHKVGKILVDAFGDRMAPPDGMQKLIDDERFGRKNGKGFYRYDDGKKKAEKKSEVDASVYGVLGVKPKKGAVSAEEIAERCILQMVNEAAHCYGEGILRSARDGDIGAIFGLGFPPFTGGPFRWADDQGAAKVVEMLDGYRDRFGPRFEAAPVLRALAKEGKGFHDEDAPPPGRHRGQ